MTENANGSPDKCREALISVATHPHVYIATFCDRSIPDGPAVESIEQRLLPLVDAQPQRSLVLDFSNVRFISSSMLGVLVTLRQKVVAIEAKLVLTGIAPQLMAFFRATRLDSLFEFADDRAEAIRMAAK